MAMSNNEQAFWNSIPPGYRFEPLDEELITHYLLRKVNDQSLPPNKMHEVELYGKLGPEELTRFYEAESENTWYFFTRLERLYDNGCRPRRSAGNGYWRMSGRDITIMNGGQTVGYKRSLAFHVGKQPGGVKTPWLMQEFRLDVPQSKPKPKPKIKRKRDDQATPSSPTLALHSGDSKPKNMLDGWVLCKVYRLGRDVPVAQEEHHQQQEAPNNGEPRAIEQQQQQEEATLPPPNPLIPSTTTTIPSNQYNNYMMDNNMALHQEVVHVPYDNQYFNMQEPGPLYIDDGCLECQLLQRSLLNSISNDDEYYQPNLLTTVIPTTNQYNVGHLPEFEDLPDDIEDQLSINDLQQKQQQQRPLLSNDQATRALNSSPQEEPHHQQVVQLSNDEHRVKDDIISAEEKRESNQFMTYQKILRLVNADGVEFIDNPNMQQLVCHEPSLTCSTVQNPTETTTTTVLSSSPKYSDFDDWFDSSMCKQSVNCSTVEIPTETTTGLDPSSQFLTLEEVDSILK